jgi:hypothetical protein
MRCCNKTTKNNVYSRPPPLKDIIIADPEVKKNPDTPGANRIYVSGPKPPKELFELTLGVQRASVRERIYLLAYTLHTGLL